MQTQMNTKNRDREMDEELADVLTAISVVAKRLAKQLQIVDRGAEEAEPHSTNVKGVKSHEQDRTQGQEQCLTVSAQSGHRDRNSVL